MTTDERERDIVAAFIGFADRLVDDFDLLDLTMQLTEDCARLLDVAAAGLLLADAGGVLHLLAATSEQARQLEVYQLQRDEGPCLDCFHTGAPISIADLKLAAARWPRFASSAAQQGFVSVHAIPMRLRHEVLGALGLFGTTPGVLTDDDLNLAQALAHVASIAIAQQNHTANRTSLLPELQAAVAGRGMLEMAKGVLAEVHGLTMREASTRLRTYARRHGRRLSELARQILTDDARTREVLLADLSDPTLAAPSQPG